MNKVFCPWCGSEMIESGYGVSQWFRCPRCRSESPHEIGIEDAYAAALRRPLQKPLTLEEACRTEEPCVFVEFKDKPEIRVSKIRCYYGGCLCEIISFSLLTTTLHSSSYGKMWRCWATKPTDEARKAAKWDE